MRPPVVGDGPMAAERFRCGSRAALVSLGLVVAPTAWAETAPVAPTAQAAQTAQAVSEPAHGPVAARVLGLEEAIRLADQAHPQIAMASAELDRMRAQVTEARWAPFSLFELKGGVTLAPELAGSGVFSPNTDVSISSSMGVGWRVGLEGVLPIWTFGKISGIRRAAQAQVGIGEASIEKERNAVRYAVQEAYLGLMVARDGEHLVGDVRGYLEHAARKLVEGPSGAALDPEEVDKAQLYALRTYLAEMEARSSELRRYESVALAGLRFYTNVVDADVPDEPLEPPVQALATLERYQQAAEMHRPELRMVLAGLRARQAQLELSRAQLYPDLGFGMFATWSAAPAVSDEVNPFANDPGNYFHYGAALLLRHKWDFVPALARVRQAEAQWRQLKAQEQLVVRGVRTEVQLAYAEAIDWKARWEAHKRAARSAKQWTIVVQQGIDIGTLPAKDIVEPAKQYAVNKYSELQALLGYHMAFAKLAKVTGWDERQP
jgi:outer membrane protein TolC